MRCENFMARQVLVSLQKMNMIMTWRTLIG
jgi:hypothetical protein